MDRGWPSSAQAWRSRSASSAWVIGGSVGERADAVSAVAAAGLSLEHEYRFAEAVAALHDTVQPVLLSLDLSDVEVDAQHKLMEMLEVRQDNPRFPTILSFARTELDRAAACAAGRAITLLCAPSMSERIAAITVAMLSADRRSDAAEHVTDAVKLQHLADEVARIAQALAGLAEPDAIPRIEAVSDGLIGYRAGPVAMAPARARTEVVRSEDVRALIRFRRRREALFAADIFADPAWDMMLDLLAARIERIKVAVSSLCIAAAVPPTTALRWIGTLTDLGIFVRVADPTDGRRVFIELSDDAAKAVLNFVAEAKAARIGSV